jgi:hypothetical protein
MNRRVALFAALLVLIAPQLASHAAPASAGSHRHVVAAAETRPAPTAVASVEHSKRVSSLGALIAYLALALSVALALLLWVRSGIHLWMLLPATGLTRRGRSPPFVRA